MLGRTVSRNCSEESTLASGMGKRRAAAKIDSAPNYERRLQQITEAAARVFDRKGFSGTTISAVAEELKIDRASLYYYISSKEELFDELVREVSEDNVAMARKIVASDLSPPEKITQLIVELMLAYERTYPILYIYIREDLGAVGSSRSKWASKMRKVNKEYDAAVIDIIQQGYDDGSFRPMGPPKIVAYAILGMINWSNRWYNPKKSDHSAKEIAEMFAQLVTGGLVAGKLPEM
jgi:AcrR family transcriptional regulator